LHQQIIQSRDSLESFSPCLIYNLALYFVNMAQSPQCAFNLFYLAGKRGVPAGYTKAVYLLMDVKTIKFDLVSEVNEQMALLDIMTRLSLLAGNEGRWAMGLAYRDGKISSGLRSRDCEIFNDLFTQVVYSCLEQSTVVTCYHARYYESFAEMLVASGDSISVSRLLGHSNVQSKIKYYKLATNYYFYALDRGSSYAFSCIKNVLEKIKLMVTTASADFKEIATIEAELATRTVSMHNHKEKLCQLSRELFSSLI
jgi:hypothetical protein